MKNNARRLGGITGKGFRPGQSGNPGGRPKKRPITERYATIAELSLPERLRRKYRLPLGVTWGDAGGFGTFEAMVKGHWGAAKEIREALEGKATQRVELTGESGGPVATKLDLPSTIAAVREIYGLTANPSQPSDDSMPSADVLESTAVLNDSSFRKLTTKISRIGVQLCSSLMSSDRRTLPALPESI